MEPPERPAFCDTCHVWHPVEMVKRKEGERRPHPRLDVRYANRHRPGTGLGQTSAAFEDMIR